MSSKNSVAGMLLKLVCSFAIQQNENGIETKTILLFYW